MNKADRALIRQDHSDAIVRSDSPDRDVTLTLMNACRRLVKMTPPVWMKLGSSAASASPVYYFHFHFHLIVMYLIVYYWLQDLFSECDIDIITFLAQLAEYTV